MGRDRERERVDGGCRRPKQLVAHGDEGERLLITPGPKVPHNREHPVPWSAENTLDPKNVPREAVRYPRNRVRSYLDACV